MNQIPFPPQNPNPNSEPNSLNPKPQNPHPQSLSVTLSSLNDLIHLSEQSIQSLLSLLPIQNPNRPNLNDLVSCPFDSRHSVPPNSLYSHFLRCSSSQFPLQSDPELSKPNYLETLKPPENGTIRTLQGSDSELCFSLDDFYADFGSNFFYRDCHGVVSLSSLDGINRTFTLPVFLSVECANFVGCGGSETKDFERDRRKILPSEFWAVKAEVESWNEYPGLYSYRALCVLSGLYMLRESDLANWVLVNSPRYGVVIDEALRNHIILLCKLCLKAIQKEALTLVDKHCSDKSLGSKNFSCPVLVQALVWLASQISVLYGEIGGKHFTLNILKQCILDAAPSLLIFSLEHKQYVDSSNSEEGLRFVDTNEAKNESFEVQQAPEIRNNEERSKTAEKSITCGVIYVSQVAAAIAALHERSLIEEKIKGLRFHHPRNNYQRMAEHDYVSLKAGEERKRRPQYRPIIEHDGLPRLKKSNEETSKAKSREELLAEERDYKRRRASYRGKKVKRSNLEVTRDIIGDYMDEIKQAGGIGCFEKGMERDEAHPSESPLGSVMTTDVYLPKTNNHNLSAAHDNSPYLSKKQYYDARPKASEGNFYKDADKPRRHRYGDHKFAEDEISIGREKRNREYNSRSSIDRSTEPRHQRMERNEMNGTETNHHDSNYPSSKTSRYHDNNKSTASKLTPEYRSRSKDRRHKDRYESHNSEPHSQRNAFKDRYDPSDSRNKYEDDVRER